MIRFSILKVVYQGRVLLPPDIDAYGLLRATHSHNPTLYSHIVGLSSHFYAHIGAGPKVFHPPMSKLMWA
ncbi:hypothetical protein [Simiaoa sunii]|uniref:hypothetical protein n=1 Tax=Simiaoa sunii TaxID=2763672 RepID=UPI0011DD4A2D|nr:hypothetical protein [Simiaoa sunii]